MAADFGAGRSGVKKQAANGRMAESVGLRRYGEGNFAGSERRRLRGLGGKDGFSTLFQ
jgi:hypothetical protein